MSSSSSAQHPSSRRASGVWFAAARIFDLSVSAMLWSRRTVFMALVVGLPIALAVAFRVLVAFDVPMAVRGTQVSGGVVFGMMMWAFFLRFSVPVLAAFYGTSLIADEVEDKTITYLFSRPIARSAIVLGKYAAYLVCTMSVMLPGIVIVWLLVAPIHGSLAATFVSLLIDLAVVTLGLAAYGAVFAWIGAATRRPLVFGLVFIFGWEWLALALPGALKRLTVAYYLEGLVPHALPDDSSVRLVQALFRQAPSMTESLLGLAVIVVAGVWLAARAVSNREYVLEQ